MCIDPRTSQLVASGGEDDKAYVWKASDGEVVLECTGKVFMFAMYMYDYNVLYVYGHQTTG